MVARCLMKTATDRAAEAVEAAEIMFADEMGATLDLSPAAKAALIVKIAAAIEAAIRRRPREARMRAVILGFLCGLAWAGVSAQSAPLAPKPAAIEFGAAPPIELVRDGRGRG